MLIYEAYQVSREKLPILSVSSGDSNDIFPVDFYIKNANHVFYIIKKEPNVHIYSHDSCFRLVDQDNFTEKCGAYVRALKDGEYVINFECMLVQNEKSANILWSKTKKIVYYNPKEWTHVPDKEFESHLMKSFDDKFYIVHTKTQPNNLAMIYAQQLARHYCYKHKKDKESSVFGKMLTLLLISRYFKSNLKVPGYLSDKFKITPIFEHKLKEELFEKLDSFIEDINEKVKENQSRCYILDDKGEETNNYCEIQDANFPHSATLLSDFLPTNDAFVYYGCTTYPESVEIDVKFFPANIEMFNVWQTDINTLVFDLVNDTLSNRVLINTYFSNMHIEFYKEVSKEVKNKLLKHEESLYSGYHPMERRF